MSDALPRSYATHLVGSSLRTLKSVALRRGSIVAGLSVAMLVTGCLTGCGAGNLRGFLQTDDLSYATSCRAYHKRHAKALSDLAYNPPTLLVQQWPKPLAGGKHATLTESSFVMRVAAGQVHRVLVSARGGVGKSTLAKALEANLCGEIPTFRVDLNTDVAARIGAGEKGNAILRQVEAKLALEARVSDRESFRELLATGPFILLLDSLDEVPVAVRPKVVAQINQVSKQFSTSAQILIFARPSVLSVDYGISDLDAKVQLPPLTCGRARSTLRWTSKSDDAQTRTEQFVRTYFIDRQSKVGNQCYYPYMAAYRDLQVVQRLAAKFNPKGNLGGLTSSLSGVHQTIVAERLRKELAALKWTAGQVLSSIDRMVRQDGRDEGVWNLVFTMDRCRQGVKALGGGAVQTNYICEKILQSALFERIAGAKEWKFAHKNVADLFLARWVDREIKRTGGSCDVVSHHGAWLGSKDVAGYLVGQPTGRACLLQATSALCKASGNFERGNVDLLYKGLPIGPARGAAVKTAMTAAIAAKLPADSCEMKTLKAL